MIDLQNDLIQAFRGGTSYHPAYEGLNLVPEDGTITATSHNLEALNLPVFGIIGFAGRVLIVFKTGLIYYARGFAVGARTEKAAALAKYLTEHTDGDWTTQYDEMLDVVSLWTVDGPVPLPPPTERDFDRSRKWGS
jgi:hypothetical protein